MARSQPRGAGGFKMGALGGLRLYIVEKIVAAHQGAVHVASGPAEGTTFTITLPRAPGGG